VPIAHRIAVRSRWSIATAMYEPMPGSMTVVLPTLIASEATTKNQPPDMLIIRFHTGPGIAKGTSRRQNFIHAERRMDLAASSRSWGTVRSDW